MASTTTPIPSSSSSSSSSWKVAAEQKRKQLQDSIPKEWLLPKHLIPPPSSNESVLNVPLSCGLLSQKEIEITAHKNVDELAGKIAGKVYTAVEVTVAYCKRAAIAHQLVNCLCCIFFEEAIEQAKQLDAYLEREKKTVGPLHGIPVSLKDQFRVKGTETVMGYISWIGIMDEDDAVLVQILRKQGAVFYCKTNVPQTLMIGETFNHVFGVTTSPFNRQLTCGGSSGGEGALIAAGGSLLGVGTDIGGSVRIPSAFNGLFGLRPSHGRLPYFGAKNSMEGFESIRSVCGPLAKSAASLTCFMKAVAAQEPWLQDPQVLPIPWREGEYASIKHTDRKLTFGVIWDDNYVRLTPPVKRALRTVVDKLIEAGHQVIDWKPPIPHIEGVNTALALFGADGGADYFVHLSKSGEPILEDLQVPPGSGLSVLQYHDMNVVRSKFVKAYLDYWNSTHSKTNTGRPVDALLCPVAPHPAPPHRKFPYCGYTMIWNLLDYTAAVLPVGFVDPSVDQWTKEEKDLPFLNAIDEVVHKAYDADLSAGAPTCIQVVGRRLQEEKILGIVEKIDEILVAGKK